MTALQVLIVKAIVFVLASLALVYVSRASLLAPRSHGFYRFFAWEAILAMVLLNIDAWFRKPFAWHQVISWCLLIVAAFLVIHATYLLIQRGKPDPGRDETPMLGLEKTTALVTVGVYRYIRHPLYSSLLFLAWGVFFKAPSWVGGLLALVATLGLVITARIEEVEDVRFFGEDYRAYMKKSRMFIPFLF